jgi:rubredoxin
MKKHKCTSCGYTYDAHVENPEFGLKPPYDFNDLPEDWVCPNCGASKNEFKVCKEDED